MTRTVLIAAFACAVPVIALAQTFGRAPALDTVTPITEVITSPQRFDGRTVKVEGVVTAVCTHEGCWMALASPGAPEGGTVRIKVDDGVIVFPVTAKGKRATAEGRIEKVGGGDAEGHEAAGEHAAHTGARVTSWQLKATGAIIH